MESYSGHSSLHQLSEAHRTQIDGEHGKSHCGECPESCHRVETGIRRWTCKGQSRLH